MPTLTRASIPAAPARATRSARIAMAWLDHEPAPDLGPAGRATAECATRALARRIPAGDLRARARRYGPRRDAAAAHARPDGRDAAPSPHGQRRLRADPPGPRSRQDRPELL